MSSSQDTFALGLGLEDQAAGVDFGLLVAPSLPGGAHVRPVLFGGVRCLFLERVATFPIQDSPKA